MPAGRPPMFDSAEALQKEIDGYFEYIKGETRENGMSLASTTIRPPETPTITGLALYLGFESRQSFYAYEKKEGFSYTIKKAHMRIENEYEKRLVLSNPAGTIFALKNLGWSDKQEIDQKTEHSGGITINWEEPPVQHSSNQGSPGELPSLQGGLPDNS